MTAWAPDEPRVSNLQGRIHKLQGQRDLLAQQQASKREEITRLESYIALGAKVEEALKVLSEEMFGQMIDALESMLTLALTDVLEQPLQLKVERGFKRGAVTIDFHVERDGRAEDIMRGQGGSVVNVLSVGLRLLALTRLDSNVHRRFLVLDEQDCWLRPDLVPRFVHIVHDAADALGFQVLMISHHDVAAFRKYADRIYRFTPGPDGVQVVEEKTEAEWKDGQ